MTRRFLQVLSLSLAVGAVAAGAQSPSRVEIEARYWSADLGGTVEVLEAGQGTTIDLADDLGVESDEPIELRLTLRPSRRTQIRLSWTDLAFAGDNVLSRTIEFAGQMYTLSTRVVSQMDVEYARAGFSWQFLSNRDGTFRLGPLVEVKGFRGEASIVAPDLPFPAEESQDFEGAFGAVGAVLDIEAGDRVQIFAEATYVVEADDADGTDFEAGARVLLTRNLAAVGGYRSFSVDATEGDDNFDIDIEGPYVGLTLRF
ncbi:MAG: YfaZ family outer membrane protein [Thermoanaerobaculia bacterium]